MNKLVLILACAAALAVGVGVAAFLLGFFPNLLASVPNTLQAITAYIQPRLEYIQQVAASIPPWLFGVLCTGATTIGGLAVNAWRNSNNREKETQQLLNTATAEASAKIDTLQNQLQAKDTQIAALAGQRPDPTIHLATIEALKADYADLQKRYAEANSLIKTVRTPTNAEMIRRLKQEGFVVVEKAA